MVNKNFCIWLTGRPGSGKTTITRELEGLLVQDGVDAVVLSMDQLRLFLTPQPKYTEEERETVYRALVLIALYIVKPCTKSVLIDATGNRRRFRELARERIPEFAEVYIKCAVEVARTRETSREASGVEKDLDRRAEKGELQGGFPGVTTPYEEPTDPKIELSSESLTPPGSGSRHHGLYSKKMAGLSRHRV